MRYGTAVGFRRALEERLRNRAADRDLPLVRLRKLVTFDRFLARLTLAGPGRWVLKGALGLEFRLGERARMTMDADLTGPVDPETAAFDLFAVQETVLEDFFVFRIERASEQVTGGAVRYRANAELGGRLFETVLIDVALPEFAIGEAELVAGPDLLEFAGIRAVEFPVIPLERQIAEKIHAYTRRYAGDRPSGRAKDLVDLVLIALFMRVDGSRLRRVLQTTFDVRDRQALPSSFAPVPPEWKTAYGKLAAETGITVGFEEASSMVAAFLNPALAGVAAGFWDPEEGTWMKND